MTGVRLGLDLGTQNTSLFVGSRGKIITEPSVLAVDRFDGRLLASGKSAIDMFGRAPSSIELLRPVAEGILKDHDASVKFIRTLIDKALWGNIVRPNILACITTDLTVLQKKAFCDILFEAGAGRACLVPTAIAAALGANVSIEKPRGVFVCNIGAGTTQTAVLTMSDIASANAIKMGSEDFSFDILRYLRKERNIEVGETTAERIKKCVAGAVLRREETAVIECGKDVLSGAPIHFEVNSTEIYEVLLPRLSSLVGILSETMRNTSAELVSDIKDNGIVLSGGGSLLYGIEIFMKKALGIPVVVVNEPKRAVIKGLAILVKNKKKLNSLGCGYDYLTEV